MSAWCSTTSSRRSTTSPRSDRACLALRRIDAPPFLPVRPEPRAPVPYIPVFAASNAGSRARGRRLPSPLVGRVFVTRQMPEGGLDPLFAAGHEVVQRPGDDACPHAELVARAAEVDALVCVLTDRVDTEVL